MSITFENSDEPIIAEHFDVDFKTQNLQDIMGFQFTLLDSITNKIKSVFGKEKYQY